MVYHLIDPAKTAVSTPRILLVPYDAHHVERYHEWMQDEALREATASDLLTLDEEYENQQSWRTAHDKLTFIVCRAVVDDAGASADPETDPGPVYAGQDDASTRMVGDVNLFLTPCDDGEDDEDEDEETDADGAAGESGPCDLQGEIDIMIAARENRHKGLGEAAVRAFLRYLSRNHEAIVREYVRGGASPAVGDAFGVTNTETTAAAATATTTTKEKQKNSARLKRLVAKINADNAGSIRLFGNLGFRQRGGPNYFNEISMVLLDFPSTSSSYATTTVPGTEPGIESGATDSGVDELGYRERFFDRSRLER
ncbi:acetyltransferase domain-containing protein [Nemania sp. NC0429]|nr:acetyltransferase domain-containing protein [Nemania sp. NC0429]